MQFLPIFDNIAMINAGGCVWMWPHLPSMLCGVWPVLSRLPGVLPLAACGVNPPKL